MNFSRLIDAIKHTNFTQYAGEKIIMLHHGRCGSTVLTNMLHEYPYIEWYGEAFKLEKRPNLPAASQTLYNSIQTLQVKRRTKKCGFEIKPMHLRDFSVEIDDFINFCKTQNVSKFITLTRKNFLRKIISSDIGHSTKKWHLKPGMTIKKDRIQLSTDKNDAFFIVNRLDSLHAEVLAIENIKTEALHLKYEDDIQNDISIGFRKLQNYINLPEKNVQPSLKRFNPEPISELLSNYDAVAETLNGTIYEWMLHD